jgi:HEPN domain-containing protein
MGRPKSVAYWRRVSAEDWKSAQALFASKRYLHALFFGHQALEKALKRLYTVVHGKNRPYTHDLLRLAGEGGIQLTESEEMTLRDVTTFNLEARYPEEKFRLHKAATRNYTLKYLMEIERWLKKLEGEVR